MRGNGTFLVMDDVMTHGETESCLLQHGFEPSNAFVPRNVRDQSYCVSCGTLSNSEKFNDRRCILKCATTPMTVDGTTANNERLRVVMGCNGDCQDRLDGDSRV